MDYHILSIDYLNRAKKLLSEEGHEFLFYAAFELRCGIEARMQEYLEGWDHISKKAKSGWSITKLGYNIDKEFMSEEQIVQLSIANDKVFLGHYYYTPVTKKLRMAGEKLGNYLHSMKKFKKSDDNFWRNLKNELNEIVPQLEIANKGTLLGPPLRKGAMGMNFITRGGFEENPFASMLESNIGKKIEFRIKRLDSFPTPENIELLRGVGKS